jgi:hypothetical protein
MSAALRRACALGALITATASIVVALALLGSAWAELSFVLVAATIVSAAGWYVLSRRGIVRVIAAVVAAGAVVAAIVVLAGDRNIVAIAAILVLAVATAQLARVALRVDPRSLRDQAPPGVRMPAPLHPVLVCNPRSGGGKADAAFVEAARERGIETVMLEPGTDLGRLTLDAIARGADVLGMAGGDGSQAIVAAIAA